MDAPTPSALHCFQDKFEGGSAGEFTHFVVMSAGDELVLRFGGLDPPPSGWKRDFVIHNIGWDKDADLHTVYGQSSEPLPFSEMKGYPYTPQQEFPRNPGLKRYFRMYQTRYQHAPAFWKHVKTFDGEN